MANIGEIAELVNAKDTRLDVGSNTYIAIQDIFLHIGRPEKRMETEGSVIYTFGMGDHWFTATLFATTPELDSLNTLNALDADGDMTLTSFKIVYTDRSTSTKTFACTGVLKDADIHKPTKGGVTVDIFVRITGDTITVS